MVRVQVRPLVVLQDRWQCSRPFFTPDVSCAIMNSSRDSTADLEVIGWRSLDGHKPAAQIVTKGQGAEYDVPTVCKDDAAWSALRQVAEVRAPRAILL